MHTLSPSFYRIATAAAVCTALFAATAVHAEVRGTAVRTTTSSSSSKSSVSSSSSSKSFSVPANTSVNSMAVSELPYCGGTNADNVLLWDSKAKKWACKTLSSFLPPKCDGADQALRFDGTSWKCETIGGLLVAHSQIRRNMDTSKWTCDTKNTWGGATCVTKSDGLTAELKCPANTLKVESDALSGYSIPAKDGAGVLKFGNEYHAYCYSRVIKIGK